MLRFTGGGSLDGVTAPSRFASPEELPPLIGDMESGCVYELAEHSTIPPHPRVMRGAMYRYRPEGP